MTHPKGKVAYNEHHAADRNKARLIHVAALASALIVTAIFVLL